VTHRPSNPNGSSLLAAFLVVAAVAGPAASRADAPLQPPHRYTLCSPSKRFCVTSDPAAGTFAHAPGKPDEPLWSIPRWFRVVYLADDPEVLVTGYDGVNLVPRRSPGTVELLTFWHRGKAVRAYRLDELVTDLRRLQKTASHYNWGRYLGFDSDGNFRLTTVEGFTLIFDPRQAKLIRRLPGDD
jgi:hypothetical protein